MQLLLLSGISTCFQVVSQTLGQVTHVLLTHPPLAFPAWSPKWICWFSSLDLHVLGTPPAFVLSQDQTLIFKSLNDCSFFFKIFVSKFIACELTSLFVWVFTPAHFSETLFSFQGTTSVRSFTSDSFHIISNSFVLCQELFWIYFFAFKFLTWRQLNILPEVFLSCKLFLKYFFISFCLPASVSLSLKSDFINIPDLFFFGKYFFAKN